MNGRKINALRLKCLWFHFNMYIWIQFCRVYTYLDRMCIHLYRQSAFSKFHFVISYKFSDKIALNYLRSASISKLSFDIWCSTNENIYRQKKQQIPLMEFTFSLKAMRKPAKHTRPIMVWNAINKLFKSNDAEIRTTTFTSISTEIEQKRWKFS